MSNSARPNIPPWDRFRFSAASIIQALPCIRAYEHIRPRPRAFLSIHRRYDWKKKQPRPRLNGARLVSRYRGSRNPVIISDGNENTRMLEHRSQYGPGQQLLVTDKDGRAFIFNPNDAGRRKVEWDAISSQMDATCPQAQECAERTCRAEHLGSRSNFDRR